MKKIKKIHKKLSKMQIDYFHKYTSMEEKNADYFLFVGKCNAIGDAIELIEENYPDYF
mgnify:CR=1 FL=1